MKRVHVRVSVFLLPLLVIAGVCFGQSAEPTHSHPVYVIAGKFKTLDAALIAVNKLDEFAPILEGSDQYGYTLLLGPLELDSQVSGIKQALNRPNAKVAFVTTSFGPQVYASSRSVGLINGFAASGVVVPSPWGPDAPKAKPNAKAIEHFNRGAHFANARTVGDDVHATEEFQAALESDPGYSDAYYYLGEVLLGRATLVSGGRVQFLPGTALAFQTYLVLEPNGTHSNAARKYLTVMPAPLLSPKAVTRANEIRTKSPTQTTVGPPTATSAKNRTPAVPQAFQNGVHWSSTPIPESMTVAFSFSERCLRDECGDGVWGASINRDSNVAIQGAQDACLSKTARHGCNTGGRYFIQCKPEDGPKWAALAIYDDQMEKLSDGEAMGYDTQAASEQWAVSNCHRDGCHVVWSQAIDCSNSQPKACGDSRNGSALEWTNSWVSAGRRCPFPSSCYPEERAVRLLDSGILMHSFQPGAITSHGVNDTTITFAAIGGVGLQKVGDLWIVTIRPTSSGTFPELLDSGIYQSHQFGLALDSETAAKQAYSFFEYHRCLGK